MSKSKNFYQILHVQQDAPSEVIRSTYRTMMQKLKMHPDLGGDQENAAIINEAYSVLIDANARAEYDKHLSLSQSSNVENGYAAQQTSHYRQTAATTLENNQCVFCELPHNHGEHPKSDSLCSRCGAALYPATKQNIELNGNRLINRVEKQWPVSFYIDWQDARGYIGMTQDVSLNGIQILTNTFVDNGKVLKLSSHLLDAVAIVVNSRSDHTILRKRWRIGLEFLTLRFHQAQGTFVKIDA